MLVLFLKRVIDRTRARCVFIYKVETRPLHLKLFQIQLFPIMRGNVFSFCLLVADNKENQNAGNKEKQSNTGKETFFANSTQALALTGSDLKPADQPVPIARTASLSKPVIKPRPRSLATGQDAENQAKVEETTERPVAPPRAKSKPSRKESEGGTVEKSAVKDSKPEPPNRTDLHAPPPVRPKTRPPLGEPKMEKKPSPNAVETTNPFFNEDTSESNIQDTNSVLEGTDGTLTDGPLVGKTKKVAPPPVPRRVDLE